MKTDWQVAVIVYMIDRSKVCLIAFHDKFNDVNLEDESNIAADVIEVIWKHK